MINLVELKSLPDNQIPTSIKYFWDRYTRSYIILVLDQEGNEIESEYVGNKVSLQYELKSLSTYYKINDVNKY